MRFLLLEVDEARETLREKQLEFAVAWGRARETRLATQDLVRRAHATQGGEEPSSTAAGPDAGTAETPPAESITDVIGAPDRDAVPGR